MKGKSKIFTITAIIAISAILVGSIATNQIVFADKEDNKGKAKGCENANEKSKVQEKNPNCDVAEDIVCTGSIGGLTVNNLLVPQGATCTMDQFNVVLGSITVEDNATLFVCADNDIVGNVVAGTGTKLVIRDKLFTACTAGTKALGINIGGDIIQNGGASFTLEGGTTPTAEMNIEGNIEITNSVGTVRIEGVNDQGVQGFVRITGGSGFTIIQGNTFNGNLEIIDMGTALIGSNSVGGNIETSNNSFVSLSSNSVDGDVKSIDNTGANIRFNSIGGDLLISGTTGFCVDSPNTVAGITDSCP